MFLAAAGTGCVITKSHNMKTKVICLQEQLRHLREKNIGRDPAAVTEEMAMVRNSVEDISEFSLDSLEVDEAINDITVPSKQHFQFSNLIIHIFSWCQTEREQQIHWTGSDPQPRFIQQRSSTIRFLWRWRRWSECGDDRKDRESRGCASNSVSDDAFDTGADDYCNSSNNTCAYNNYSGANNIFSSSERCQCWQWRWQSQKGCS